MNSHHPKLRALLKDSDGLTVRQLESELNLDFRTIRKSLKLMPDAFIDRWTGPERGQWAAVWCVVEVPEDCPRPNEKNIQAPSVQAQRASGTRSDDLGDGEGNGATDNVGVDQRQAAGGQALGSLGKALWQRLRGTNQKLDAGDQKQ
jgi:hypothetical protein